jgi:GGDEF domain-containing protein
MVRHCAHLEVVFRFKSWNDTDGYASGDALLRELPVLLRAAATDPGDIVARNGGDEFCVAFSAAEKSKAIERAERLRASIADADFRGPHAPASSGEEVWIKCRRHSWKSPTSSASTRCSFAATALPKNVQPNDDANEEWPCRLFKWNEQPFHYTGRPSGQRGHPEKDPISDFAG